MEDVGFADAKVAREARVFGAIAALRLTDDQPAPAHSQESRERHRHLSRSVQALRTSLQVSEPRLLAVIASAHQLSAALRSQLLTGEILPGPTAQEHHEKLQAQGVSFEGAGSDLVGFENPTAAADAAHRLSENPK